jgi:hypothetical protein
VLSTISEGSSSNRHRHIDDDDDADDGNISGGSSSSRSSSELVGSAGTARRRQRKRHLGLWAQIQLIFSRRTFLLCEKTHLYAMSFYTESASFYQDRLGTNIGKALKRERDAFSQVGWAGCCGEHAVGCFRFLWCALVAVYRYFLIQLGYRCNYTSIIPVLVPTFEFVTFVCWFCHDELWTAVGNSQFCAMDIHIPLKNRISKHGSSATHGGASTGRGSRSVYSILLRFRWMATTDHSG